MVQSILALVSQCGSEAAIIVNSMNTVIIINGNSKAPTLRLKVLNNTDKYNRTHTIVHRDKDCHSHQFNHMIQLKRHLSETSDST